MIIKSCHAASKYNKFVQLKNKLHFTSYLLFTLRQGVELFTDIRQYSYVQGVCSK